MVEVADATDSEAVSVDMVTVAEATVEMVLKFGVVVGTALEAEPLDSDTVAVGARDSDDVATETVDAASVEASVFPVAEVASVSTAACVLVRVAPEAV